MTTKLVFNKNDTGTDEIALIATWTSDHNYQHIHKALLLAKRKVLFITGSEIYDIAQEHYDSSDYGSDANDDLIRLNALVHWFQIVLVNFAYMKNLAKDYVIWNNAGINVTWSELYRPAQKEALKKVSDSLEADGYEFLDLLIEFLNDEIKTFTEFEESLENKKLKELFINDAEEFTYFFNIKHSVSYFFEILDVIRRAQRTDINYAVGPEIYAQILDYQDKRLELELITNSVEKVEDLPASPPSGTIYLVTSENQYYKFNTTWAVYAYDAREILNLIKPTLVDLCMHAKFLSDITNIKAASEPKQIEILRANANFLKEKAEVGLAQITDYVESLEIVEETTEEETIDEIIGGDNSIMM